MEGSKQIIGVAVRCMDKRRTEQSRAAFQAAIGNPLELYELTEPGGAGVLNGLFGDGPKEWLLTKIGICLKDLGCTEVYLSTHGASAKDGRGCGGYILKGHKDEFSDPERSRTFMIGELRKAQRVVKERFPHAKVRAFYITFAEDARNFAEEISFE